MRMWPWKNKQQKPPSERVDIGLEEIGGEFNELSPTWVYIKGYIQTEIERLRERNDSLTADERKTAHIRGEIKALKRLLHLPDEKRRGLIATDDID